MQNLNETEQNLNEAKQSLNEVKDENYTEYKFIGFPFELNKIYLFCIAAKTDRVEYYKNAFNRADYSKDSNQDKFQINANPLLYLTTEAEYENNLKKKNKVSVCFYLTNANNNEGIEPQKNTDSILFGKGLDHNSPIFNLSEKKKIVNLNTCSITTT